MFMVSLLILSDEAVHPGQELGRDAVFLSPELLQEGNDLLFDEQVLLAKYLTLQEIVVLRLAGKRKVAEQSIYQPCERSESPRRSLRVWVLF